MTKLTAVCYRGRFNHEVSSLERNKVVVKEYLYPTQWVRWDSRAAEPFLSLVFQHLSDPAFRREVPRWIQKKIEGHPTAVESALAAAGAAYSPQFALEAERQRRLEERRRLGFADEVTDIPLRNEQSDEEDV
jgi:hypothetical protein